MNKYDSWIKRLLAYFIDFIIIMLFVVPLNYFNITEHKSFFLFLFVFLFSISYKPILEFYYNKTIGKHLLRLIVKDIRLNRIRIMQAYLRNIFFILPSLLSSPFYFLAFKDPILVEITDFKNFAIAMSSRYPLQNIIGNLTFFILIIDSLFLLFDKKKKNRTLHDILAKTLVIQKTKATKRKGNDPNTTLL